MKRFWFLSILFLYPVALLGQEIHCSDKISCDSVYSGIKIHYDTLTQNFAGPLNCASNFFPELKNYNIEIRRKKIRTMMAARPRKDFMFHSRENRTYEILITNKPDMNADDIFNSMGSCAKTGVFGHELSHIVTYSQKNNLQLAWFGISYYFNRKKIESQTDMMAIQRGFGNELVKYTQYIHHSPKVNKNYLHRKNKYYLSATELESKIRKTY